MEKFNHNEALYCKLYVNTDTPNLLELVVNITQGKHTQRTVTTDSMEASVIVNKSADKRSIPLSENECVSFPWYLEIDQSMKATREMFINAVSVLMNELREHDCMVVAACDFEDELPIASRKLH